MTKSNQSPDVRIRISSKVHIARRSVVEMAEKRSITKVNANALINCIMANFVNNIRFG